MDKLIPRHNKLLRDIAILAIIFALIIPASFVSARSISDIQQEINEQQNELNDVQTNLDDAKAALANSQSTLANSTSELDKLQAEIDVLVQEIAINEIELELIQAQIVVKELERDERELRRDQTLESNYIDWRVRDVQQYKILNNEESDSIEKNRQYDSFLTEIQQNEILTLLLDLTSLDQLLKEYNEKITELEVQNTELQNKKADLEAQVLALQNAVNASYSSVNSLQSQQENIQNQIKNLEEEQKAAFEREREILEQDPGGGGGEVAEGEWYFYGSGRDLYQGHGVGFSQWGAHGLGLNGFNYKQIATFYYPGTAVANYPVNQFISIKYCADNPTYVTPDSQGICRYYDNSGNLLYTGQMVIKRITFNDYLGGLGEVPESWPIETRKAQIVIARTYAVNKTNNGHENIPICITASCQVTYLKKNGNDSDLMADDEKEVVDATANEVVLFNNLPIEAVYSSDNNQGYGTADNDTIWQNFSGNGNPYPYLRSVNDNDYASKTQWTNWVYQTNGFTASDLDALLNYVANGNAYSSSIKAEMQSIISAIGNVQSISFIRDSSLRIKKVQITGSTGQTRTIGGWWFKNIWNSWIYDTGQNDYLYSQSFFLAQ